MSESNARPPQPIAFSPDRLGQGLLNAMIGEMKSAPNMWAKMNESQQEVVIRRLEVSVRNWTLETMRILFSAKVPAVSATLEEVKVKDDIDGKITIARTAEDRHELADRVGQQVVVVMVNADAYFDRMNEVKADSQQRNLFGDNGEIPGTGRNEPDGPQGGGGGGKAFDATAQAEALSKIFNLPAEDSHSPKAEDFKAQLKQDLIAKGIAEGDVVLDLLPDDSLVELRAWLDNYIPCPEWFVPGLKLQTPAPTDSAADSTAEGQEQLGLGAGECEAAETEDEEGDAEIEITGDDEDEESDDGEKE